MQNSIQYLGVLIDSSSVWKDHINQFSKKNSRDIKLSCLQFALIATSRLVKYLKLGKVLKVVFAWIKVIPFLHFLW